MSLYAIMKKHYPPKSLQKVEVDKLEKSIREIAGNGDITNEKAVSAKLIVEILDQKGVISDEKLQKDMFELIAEFSEILEEFSEPESAVEFSNFEEELEKNRLLKLNENGTVDEVDEKGNIIGPLSRGNYQPIEGHPEFYKEEDDYKILQIPLAGKEIHQQEEHISQHDVVLETNIGYIYYRVLAYNYSFNKMSIQLFFDSSPPSFIPKVGQRFKLNVKSDNISVIYTGVNFVLPFATEVRVLSFTILEE